MSHVFNPKVFAPVSRPYVENGQNLVRIEVQLLDLSDRQYKFQDFSIANLMAINADESLLTPSPVQANPMSVADSSQFIEKQIVNA